MIHEKVCWTIFCFICSGFFYILGVANEKIKLTLLLKHLHDKKFKKKDENKEYLTAIGDVMRGSDVEDL